MGHKNINILLFDDGLCVAEDKSGSCIALSSTRKNIREFLNRKELNNTLGVYILMGTDNKTKRPKIYIGEGDVKARIKTHHKNEKQDFWVKVIAFISNKRNGLEKTHTQYIEKKLIKKAKSAQKADVNNGNKGTGRLGGESDILNMDTFLKEIYLMLPMLGINYFISLDYQEATDDELLFCKIKGLTAKGKRTDNGFIIFKGSQTVLETTPKADEWIKRDRQSLIGDGVLEKKNNCLEFTKNYEFASASAAAIAVRGCRSNGLIEWKNKDKKPLKEIEAESI